MEKSFPVHALSIDVVGFHIDAYGIPAIIAVTIIAVIVLHLSTDRVVSGLKLLGRQCRQSLRQSTKKFRAR